MKKFKHYDFVGVDNDDDGKVIFYLSRSKFDKYFPKGQRR